MKSGGRRGKGQRRICQKAKF